jgi:flagellar biosynthesis protein
MAETPVDDLAVALCYDPAAGRLPFVSAKGRGAVARQIRDIAAQYRIAIHKDRELTQILAGLDVGSPIPVAAFAAVAEILAYLFRINRAHDRDEAGKEMSDDVEHSGG